MGTIEQLRPGMVEESMKKEEIPHERIPLERIARTESVVRVKGARGKVVQTIRVEECAPPMELRRSDIPVIVAPGFTEGPDTLRSNLQCLAQEGYATFTYDAPLGISGKSESLAALTELQQELKFQKYHVRKAAALLAVLKEKNPETKVNAIGHSEGCIYLVLAALARPKKFRTLFLENPGGMVGNDTFFALIDRAYKHKQQEKKEAMDDHLLRNMLSKASSERKKNFRQSLVRGVPAPRAIACTQIQELLLLLKEQGVHIVIAHSVDDVIFPMDRVQEMSSLIKRQNADGSTGKTYLDGFLSIPGGHNAFFLDPEIHATLASSVFSTIDAREKDISPDSGQPLAEIIDLPLRRDVDNPLELEFPEQRVA